MTAKKPYKTPALQPLEASGLTVGQLRSLLKFVPDSAPVVVCAMVEAKGSVTRIVVSGKGLSAAGRPAEKWGVGDSIALVIFAEGDRLEMGVAKGP